MGPGLSPLGGTPRAESGSLARLIPAAVSCTSTIPPSWGHLRSRSGARLRIYCATYKVVNASHGGGFLVSGALFPPPFFSVFLCLTFFLLLVLLPSFWRSSSGLSGREPQVTSRAGSALHSGWGISFTIDVLQSGLPLPPEPFILEASCPARLLPADVIPRGRFTRS